MRTGAVYEKKRAAAEATARRATRIDD